MLNEEIIINELVNPELNDWNKISKYQYLTEEFIEKHQNELNWRCISRYQKLSGEFIEKYKNKRSEEHTSELQSRQYLVCRLLLEKKKNYKYPILISITLSLLLHAYHSYLNIIPPTYSY